MKTIRHFSLPGLLFLVVLGCCNTALAQPEPQTPQKISLDDVKSYIETSKRSNERWGTAPEKYVLDNFARPELTQSIDNWQARNRTRLSKEIRIRVVVDYLLTEMNLLNKLPSVLDSISEGQSNSVANEFKTQVASNVTRQYQAARIEVQINVDVADLAIDDKGFGRIRNKDMFVVMPSKPHVVVVTSGSRSCTQTVTADPGKVVTVPCNLN